MALSHEKALILRKLRHTMPMATSATNKLLRRFGRHITNYRDPVCLHFTEGNEAAERLHVDQRSGAESIPRDESGGRVGGKGAATPLAAMPSVLGLWA